jgi:hypothetical protein
VEYVPTIRLWFKPKVVTPRDIEKEFEATAYRYLKKMGLEAWSVFKAMWTERVAEKVAKILTNEYGDMEPDEKELRQMDGQFEYKGARYEGWFSFPRRGEADVWGDEPREWNVTGGDLSLEYEARPDGGLEQSGVLTLHATPYFIPDWEP